MQSLESLNFLLISSYSQPVIKQCVLSLNLNSFNLVRMIGDANICLFIQNNIIFAGRHFDLRHVLLCKQIQNAIQEDEGIRNENS